MRNRESGRRLPAPIGVFLLAALASALATTGCDRSKKQEVSQQPEVPDQTNKELLAKLEVLEQERKAEEVERKAEEERLAALTAILQSREGGENEEDAGPANWFYSEYEDKMTGTSTKFAVARARNQVEFDFPYQGPQRAILRVQNHPRNGKDVLLGIERGQFLCGIYDCKVTVRFGENKPTKIRAVGPEDNSTTLLFLRQPEKFIASMQKVEEVFVEATFFQEGNRVFEFDVSGFEPEKVGLVRASLPTIGSSGKAGAAISEPSDPLSPFLKKDEEPLDLPESLSQADIDKGMQSVAEKVKACCRGAAGGITIDVVISPKGRVVSAKTPGGFRGTPEGDCAEKAVSRIGFPAARNQTRGSFRFTL